MTDRPTVCSIITERGLRRAGAEGGASPSPLATLRRAASAATATRVAAFTIAVFVLTAPAAACAAVAPADPVALLAYPAAALAVGTTIDDVCCGSAASAFAAEPTASVRTGSPGPMWLRLDRVKPGSVLLLSAVVDRAELFWRDRTTGRWRPSLTGDHVPAADRTIASPDMALPIPPSAATGPVFLRVVQPSIVTVRFDAYSPTAFMQYRSHDLAIKLLLLGFVLAIVAYNLVVSVLICDRVFLLNAATIVAMVVVAAYLSGYGALYLWPSRPSAGEQVMNGALLLANALGLLFIRDFLVRGAPDRRRHRLLLLPLPLLVLAWAAGLAGPYQTGRHALLAASLLTLALLAWVLLRGSLAGDRRARIMSVPFLLGMIPGILFTSLHRIGGVDLGWFSQNALEVSLALEALLFSFVIVARVRSAEAARSAADDALLAARRNASATLLNAQDAERRRVAQDLHDSVGQRLLFLINALRLANHAGPAGKSPDVAATTVDDATRVLDDLRRIARTMHPATLDHLGWRGAVGLLIDDMNRQTGIACQADFADRTGPPGTERRLHLYRIVQEALNNVIRHARAARCRVRVERRPASFVIRIDDDGIGAFEVDGSLKSVGLGLTSIDERVRILGGRWRIGWSDLGGTRFEADVPLPALIGAPDGAGADGRLTGAA